MIDGKPVYPEFLDSLHVPAEPIAPLPYAPVDRSASTSA